MMLLGIREAYALGIVSIGFRVFFTIYVDNPQTLNSGWITALAGCLAVLPMTAALGWVGRSYDKPPAQTLDNAPGRFLFAFVALLSIFDAGMSLSLLSHSSTYVALEYVPRVWVSLGCVIGVALGCLGGLDAIGSTARVWLRILFFLLVIVIIAIIPLLKPGLLFPVLGPGIKTLASPVPAIIGITCQVFPLWLLREKPTVKIWRFSPTSMIIAAGLVSAGLLLLTGMLLPSMPEFPPHRVFQLDKLLTNGRVSVQLQLPLLFIWFGCYLLAIAFSLVIATHTVQYAFPGIPRWTAVLICAIAAFGISLSGMGEKGVIAAASIIRLCAYTLVTAALVVICVINKKRSGAPE
ncbi:MAG: hypothetical protein Q4D04_03160 [Clostridia bacterium]|nr:hypothetical protein [Clostridia bacterium]